MNESFLQLRELITSKVSKDTFVVLLGNIASSSLAVIFTILAARILGPENWGIIAAIGSLITILVAVSDLGLSSALFRFVSKKWVQGARQEAQDVIKTIWTLRFISVLLFASILLIFSDKLAQILLKINDPQFIVFVALGLIGALFIDFQIAESEARQEWRKAAVFISLTNILRVAGLFIIGLENLNLINVTFAFTSASVVAYMISLLWQRTSTGFVTNWQKIVREVIPFSGFMGANKIVSSVSSRVDVLILIQMAGAYEAGIYGAANRLAIGVPLILASFATVLAPRFASISNSKDILVFFKRSVGLAGIITAGLIVGIIVAPYVVYLFGPAYERSGVVLQLLFASFIPSAISVPAVNFVIYALKKPQIITLLSVVQLPIILFLNISLIPKIGVFAPVLALSVVNTLTAIVTFFVSIWFLSKKI